jgi:hypothetical protein
MWRQSISTSSESPVSTAAAESVIRGIDPSLVGWEAADGDPKKRESSPYPHKAHKTLNNRPPWRQVSVKTTYENGFMMTAKTRDGDMARKGEGTMTVAPPFLVAQI